LTKIKISFQLLQENADKLAGEKQILLNIYYSELTHAMQCTEAAFVPKRKVCLASKVPRLSLNPELVKLLNFGIIFGTIVFGLVLLMTLDFILSIVFL